MMISGDVRGCSDLANPGVSNIVGVIRPVRSPQEVIDMKFRMAFWPLAMSYLLILLFSPGRAGQSLSAAVFEGSMGALLGLVLAAAFAHHRRMRH